MSIRPMSMNSLKYFFLNKSQGFHKNQLVQLMPFIGYWFWKKKCSWSVIQRTSPRKMNWARTLAGAQAHCMVMIDEKNSDSKHRTYKISDKSCCTSEIAGSSHVHLSSQACPPVLYASALSCYYFLCSCFFALIGKSCWDLNSFFFLKQNRGEKLG